MGYLEAWKVLDAKIADFRNKGLTVPPETMVELKSARTLISILLADSNCVSVKPRIEEYLFNVESYIMAKGQGIFGIEYTEKWISELDQATKKPDSEDETTRAASNRRDIPLGLPRSLSWVRISLLPELQIEQLRKLADTMHLSCVSGKDGGLLLRGDKDQLREFIKNVASTNAENKVG